MNNLFKLQNYFVTHALLLLVIDLGWLRAINLNYVVRARSPDDLGYARLKSAFLLLLQPEPEPERTPGRPAPLAP